MKPRVRILLVTDDWDGVANGGFLQWADQAPADRKGLNARAFHLGSQIRRQAAGGLGPELLRSAEAHWPQALARGAG